MLDFTRPLQLRYANNPNAYPINPDGTIPNSSGRIENVPVTHRRLAVLYTYKGGPPAGALFVDEASIGHFICNNPVRIISKKFIEIVEGEGI